MKKLISILACIICLFANLRAGPTDATYLLQNPDLSRIDELDPDLVLNEVLKTLGNKVFEKPNGDVSFVFDGTGTKKIRILTYRAKGSRDYIAILHALKDPRISEYGHLEGVYIGADFLKGVKIKNRPQRPINGDSESIQRWAVTQYMSDVADASERNAPMVYRGVEDTWKQSLRAFMPYMGLFVIFLCILYMSHDTLGRELTTNLSWRDRASGQAIFSFWVLITIIYTVSLLLLAIGILIDCGLGFFEANTGNSSIWIPSLQCIGVTLLLGAGLDILIKSDKYTEKANRLWLGGGNQQHHNH